MSIFERISERWAVRAGVTAMFVVLAALAGFSLVTQRRTTDLAVRAGAANRLAATLQDARHWLGETRSPERESQIEGSYRVRDEHVRALREVYLTLDRADLLDGSPATRRK